MTPSNPNNNQPLIYRIADALGVLHLVASVNHTHSQAEIDGLATALAAKQDALTFDSTPTPGSTNPVTSGGVKAALDGKANATHGHDSIGGTSTAQDASIECNQDTVNIYAKEEIRLDINDDVAVISSENIGNVWNAFSDPDSTPTANSNKLVTSGGVKAALDGKANATHGHDSITGTNAEVACGQGEVNLEAQDEINMSFGDSNKATLTPQNIANLKRALTSPDSTPTASSDNLVTSGGVKAAIDALLTNRIPIHQLVAILPKTSGLDTAYEEHSWLGDGKMALVLQTARPLVVDIEARGADDSPEGTWSDTTDISFNLTPGVRTIKNIYDLMSAQLSSDYPGEYIGNITNWKIRVAAQDTVSEDTACLINFYNPTSAE